ncbi:MAG: hypothetical protein U5K69_05825 [Balneolaceae bacterium]|nr:hypothetical protein [Balneolaceae bacterium]
MFAYPKEQVRTVVEEGSVLFGLQEERSSTNPPTQTTLKHHEIGEIDINGMLTRNSTVQLDKYLGWKDGKLVFYENPIARDRAQAGTLV